MNLDNEIRKLIKDAKDVPEDKKRALLRQMGHTGVHSGDCREDLGSHTAESDIRKGTFHSGEPSGVGKWGG